MSHKVEIDAAVLARALSALENRIRQLETNAIPAAKERRNFGIAKILETGLANDKDARDEIKARLTP